MCATLVRKDSTHTILSDVRHAAWVVKRTVWGTLVSPFLRWYCIVSFCLVSLSLLCWIVANYGRFNSIEGSYSPCATPQWWGREGTANKMQWCYQTPQQWFGLMISASSWLLIGWCGKVVDWWVDRGQEVIVRRKWKRVEKCCWKRLWRSVEASVVLDLGGGESWFCVAFGAMIACIAGYCTWLFICLSRACWLCYLKEEYEFRLEIQLRHYDRDAFVIKFNSEVAGNVNPGRNCCQHGYVAWGWNVPKRAPAEREGSPTGKKWLLLVFAYLKSTSNNNVKSYSKSKILQYVKLLITFEHFS